MSAIDKYGCIPCTVEQLCCAAQIAACLSFMYLQKDVDKVTSLRRRFAEDDWEVMRSRVRRLGRSGSPAPGPLMGSKATEEEATDDQGAPLLLSRCAAQTGLLV